MFIFVVYALVKKLTVYTLIYANATSKKIMCYDDIATSSVVHVPQCQ